MTTKAKLEVIDTLLQVMEDFATREALTRDSLLKRRQVLLVQLASEPPAAPTPAPGKRAVRRATK